MDKLPRSKKELETHNRIRVLLWAYAYEFMNNSLVDDNTFDSTCLLIDLNTKTDRPDMDEWFKANFAPFTGQWIHSLPQKELDRLHTLYMKYGVGYENRTNGNSSH